MTAPLPAAQSLNIVDFGVGMAAALVAKQFASLGAKVSRIEPDGGDPFYETYPAYRIWRGEEIPCAPERADDLLDKADICILGGEDFPGLTHPREAEELSRRYPRLVVLHLRGYIDERSKSRPAVDLLVQARTGLVYEQFSQRPVAAAFPIANYGAALQGTIGAWVALIERERSGLGQVVTASLAGGAAMFWAPFWMRAEKADAGFTGITPRDVRHLILECANREYIHLTMGVVGAVSKVYAILGIPHPVDPLDRGMPCAERGALNFFGDVDLLNAYAANRPRAQLLDALREAGVPAEAVLAPGECWDDEQVALNGILRTDKEGWRSVGSPIHYQVVAPISPRPPRSRYGREMPVDPAPLADIRILDCGIFVAGPYASKLLADYGADVIRVEPPTGRSTLSGERTIICATHGKRSICLDAKSAEGRRILAELCRDADIVHHNFRPGVASRIGIDQASLRAINPNLITLETTAYGGTGPKAAMPGFDMIMQAHCGFEKRAGGVDNPPLCSRSPLVDFAAGAVGAIALLVGIYEAKKGGTAIAAETNLLNVGLHMMSELVQAPDGTLAGAPLLNHDQTGIHPAEALYQTRDGWVAIAARSNAMAQDLARLLDLADLGERSGWCEPQQRALAERIRAHKTAELLSQLHQSGIWAEECVCDAWAQVAADGVVMREMEDKVYGRVTHCIGPLVSFSRSKTYPHPRLSIGPGEDTRAILAELGMAAETVEALFEARTVV